MTAREQVAEMRIQALVIAGYFLDGFDVRDDRRRGSQSGRMPREDWRLS